MDHFYTSEKHIQILIALLKAHGIRYIVASPGTTNMTFIASVQYDSYFHIISSVDERSAAYIACGLSEEIGEPVVLSCTGATASRNYMSGLTEAYYRKIPILAITSTQYKGKVGHNIAQVLDRTVVPKDVAKYSTQITAIHTEQDKWNCEIEINRAILELTRNGKGPVHINLETTYSLDYSVKELPKVNVINRLNSDDILPELECEKVGIYVGAHSKWSDKLTSYVEQFCEKYNGVVICDHSSNYKGKYAFFAGRAAMQSTQPSSCFTMDVLINIGNVSSAAYNIHAKEVWRVNPDGELRDTFKKLSNIFAMEEEIFFKYYISKKTAKVSGLDYWKECEEISNRLENKTPELPFSNIWIAQETSHRLPHNSVVHFGILNTLRSWNFFKVDESIFTYCNTGGFGIDGCVSAMLGASLANPNKLYFGFVGDLAMFYDMNVLGNRHVGNNVRIMVVNNGGGQEFRNTAHAASRLGEDAGWYIAATGHFGNKSDQLLQHYAKDLGFEYIAACTKEEYCQNIETFVNPIIQEKPILFEVFTESEKENEALLTMCNLQTPVAGVVKKTIRKALGDDAIATISKIIKR